jgi:SnoaL-like domain
MIPTTYGLEAGKQAFADLFELIPDMTAEVHRWGATSDGVLIEFTVRGTAGGAPISWQSVDRFILAEDGLATERFTYFDSMPLVLTVMRRPRTWLGFMRSRIKQMRHSRRRRPGIT